MLIERAKDPDIGKFESIATNEQERAVLKKYHGEIFSVFNSLKVADEKVAFSMQAQSLEELKQKLKENGYRTFNAKGAL